MRLRFATVLLFPSLIGCHSRDRHPKDTSTFNKRIACAKLATSDKWDDVITVPYLDSTYYSPAKDTCIFVMKTTFPAEKDRNIDSSVIIVDALTRKQIWANDPKLEQTDEQLTTELNQQLQKLQINP